MSETSDWKQKYRDCLLEMQAEERRWRESEQVLRRLIGRLCAAGMGVDPQLDHELSGLAAANRRNADAEELARMADTLTTTVVALDAVSPVTTSAAAGAQTTAQTRAAVQGLWEDLPQSGELRDARRHLLGECSSAKSDAALASVVVRAADLVHGHAESLMRERLQAASILTAVTKRLEEVAGYLKQSDAAGAERYADAQSHNDAVLTQVRELTGEVSSATELRVLQSLVTTRLERVAREVCDFRAREELRLLEINGRAQSLHERIAELELEAQDLSAKLDSEKHAARLDPLTGVGNRKAFDERFAQSLLRRREQGSPVIMLLWDIDNFKFINDSYGHRAGDRVLQSVATCFTAAARVDDFVARIGGEEFALLLPGMGAAEALQAANLTRSKIAGLRLHFRGTPVRVTVSCGLTEMRADDTAPAAFDRADSALYRAKQAGKNQCILADGAAAASKAIKG